MEGLLRILRAAHCRSTHHYFALDALRHIRTSGGHQLARMLLRYHRAYLAGARDPDTRFRDFQNHVVHVADSHWGGAPRAAERWYGRLQQFLRDEAWADAAHAAGVLSHYFTDPLQPLHTAHGHREAIVHRPLEWSIWQRYDAILGRWREDRFHVVFQLSSRADWLSSAVIKGAELAHRSYDTLVSTYDIQAATRHPARGLSDAAIEALAELFGVAITGWARVLERTAEEAEDHLPQSSLGFTAVAALAGSPLARFRRWAENRHERAQVLALLRYYERTGGLGPLVPPEVALVRKVLQVRERETMRTGSPPEDNATALRIMAPPGNVEQSEPVDHGSTSGWHPPAISAADGHGSAGARRLTLASPIDEAPSIGPKTAARLQQLGIGNLSQFLGSSPEELAQRLRVRWITAEQVVDWQAQTRLILNLPGLRVRDAQLLVAVGCRTPQLLETADVQSLNDQIQRYSQGPAGKRVLRGASPPSRQELAAWITASQTSGRAAA